MYWTSQETINFPNCSDQYCIAIASDQPMVETWLGFSEGFQPMFRSPCLVVKHWFILVAFLFLCGPVIAAGNFVKVRLPVGVSIDLPRNWIVLSGNQRITLDTAVESGLDLSGRQKSNSMLPFAANYYSDDRKVEAMVNVRFYPDMTLTQEDARAATFQDVAEIDAVLRKDVPAGVTLAGGQVVSWKGTEKNTLNGLIVFTSEYQRTSIVSSGNFQVRLVRVFLANRSFTLTVSYVASHEPLLRLITDRIISSLRVSGVS